MLSEVMTHDNSWPACGGGRVHIQTPRHAFSAVALPSVRRGRGQAAPIDPDKARRADPFADHGQLLAGAPTLVPCRRPRLMRCSRLRRDLKGAEGGRDRRSRSCPPSRILLSSPATVTCAHAHARSPPTLAVVHLLRAAGIRTRTGDMSRRAPVTTSINLLPTSRSSATSTSIVSSARTDHAVPAGGPHDRAMLLKNT